MNKHYLVIPAAVALVAGCVDHRPIRNGLRSESSYMTKEELTEPNPKLAGTELEGDDTWLYRINVVGTSAPSITGDFPGAESGVKLVRFRFREDALQVVDAQRLQYDDPEDPNDDTTNTVDRILLEFPGQHVDVKLHESLDGERTNLLEENTERDWEERQSFRVDWEDGTLGPVDAMGAINGYFTKQCGRPVSNRLVPDSFEWDADEQYLTFEVETHWVLDLNGALCYAWAFLGQHVYDTNVVDSGTVVYKYNFYRRGPSSYVPEYIAEKDPVNKRYGAFQLLNLYVDGGSGLLGGKRLLRRFDPNATEPAVFYFSKGFPEKFKPMFLDPEEGIGPITNKIMEDAGASLRFEFKDHDFDGVERKSGDIRYNWVNWTGDQFAGGGVLGVGYGDADPRTGEVISANVNMYAYAYDLFRFFTEEYLADVGGPEAGETCSPGALLAPSSDEGRLNSALFNEMRFVMDLDEDHQTGTAADFVPEPQAETFAADYHRILPEVRYGYPGWNAYVYQTSGMAPVEHLGEMMIKEVQFQDEMQEIMLGEDPFGGTALHTREGIELQNDFIRRFREYRKNHQQLKAELSLHDGMRSIYKMDEGDWLHHLRKSARLCKEDGTWETDEEYADRFLYGIIYRLAIHEFGHTISLRHNFFGSMDKKHFRDDSDISSSVMDYIALESEAGAKRGWGVYDENALKWIYGTEDVREEVMADDPLYCTDEHRILSSLCRAYDFGTTPAEVVLNEIEDYDWGYKYRNRRAYREFWSVGSYYSRVFGYIFDIQRMWYLSIFDWGGGGVQQTLKRLDQTEGKPVLSQAEYDERSVDFYNDLAAANEMTIAFYDSIINQSASFRNYQTEFDPFYGDVRRIGIINDKLFATFAFMDLQDVYYSPNISTYVSMWDAPFGSRAYGLSQRVLDNMLGANYDTFPWFRYYAIAIFAGVANSNLVGSLEAKERIAIQRFNRVGDMHEVYPPQFSDVALRPDNPQQTFVYEGEEYVYTYLPDRNWHLVAGRSRNPVSFQFMRDYNEALNGNASTGTDTYGLKILLAYHEYYNNFVGY